MVSVRLLGAADMERNGVVRFTPHLASRHRPVCHSFAQMKSFSFTSVLPRVIGSERCRFCRTGSEYYRRPNFNLDKRSDEDGGPRI